MEICGRCWCSYCFEYDTHWHCNLICDSGGGSAGLSSDAHYVSVQTAPGTVYIGTVGMLSTSLVPRASFVVDRTTFKGYVRLEMMYIKTTQTK